jgi:HK97 family phage major capsid protein
MENVEKLAEDLKVRLEGLEKMSKDNDIELKSSKNEVEILKADLAKVSSKDELKVLEKSFEELSKAFEKSKTGTSEKELPTLKEALFLNKAKFESLKENKGSSFEITYKATQAPADIGSRASLGLMLPGIGNKPFRAFSVLELFRRVPVTKEFIKYYEQDTVTRDAKVVVACAASTHTSKITWIERVLQITKIRDFVDICLDMMDDYDFVSSQVDTLLNQSVKGKEESEILLGTGTNPSDILSIETISSEFDAENGLAPFDGANQTGFQSPTLAELTGAMKAQIYTFGQQNAWNADTILMNYSDFVRFQHAKNRDGDYLLPNFVYTNGGVLNGMQVVTSPLVAPNTLYVLDSTKGEILDRNQITLEFSYENKQNFEQELVTAKAVERMQFHVSIINRDAFMKCEDIGAALTAITNVAV